MLSSNRFHVVGLICLLAAAMPAAAAVTLPHVFGSNMVLQRGRAVPVWGWAEPGEKVTVSIAGQEQTTTADERGQWRVELEPLQTGTEPLTMTVEGNNKVTLNNVLVGEVWVCSGQSNMAWPLRQTASAETEIAAADHPRIRLLDVSHDVAPSPRGDVYARWRVCSPETIPGFSAVAYFFGRKLQQELDVPIGLISTSWGGTRIEPWTPVEGFAAVPSLESIDRQVQQQRQRFRQRLEPFIPAVEAWARAARKARAAGETVPPLPALPGHELHQNGQPTTLYNGMVAPLVPMAIRGAIWYQGESNIGDGMDYLDKMKALIAGWRKMWGQGEFPFYYVQLAPYRYGGNPTRLPEIWEAQVAALSIPSTGMVVTNDIGNVSDIHPRNKQDVGLRLALWALAKTYGHEDIVYSGPLYKSMTVEGETARISFDHVGSGLASRDGKPLTRFEIAGPDGEFHEAQATIEGDTVVVASDQVEHPATVRYAWNQIALGNLMNKEGLPASAFRTDGPLANR